jgi:hypothetical protein
MSISSQLVRVRAARIRLSTTGIAIGMHLERALWHATPEHRSGTEDLTTDRRSVRMRIAPRWWSRSKRNRTTSSMGIDWPAGVDAYGGGASVGAGGASVGWHPGVRRPSRPAPYRGAPHPEWKGPTPGRVVNGDSMFFGPRREIGADMRDRTHPWRTPWSDAVTPRQLVYAYREVMEPR